MAGFECKVVQASVSDLEKALSDLKSEGFEIVKIMSGEGPILRLSPSPSGTEQTDAFVVIGKKSH